MAQESLSQSSNEPPTDSRKHWLQRTCPRWVSVIVLVLISAIVGGPYLLSTIGYWVERRASYNLLAAATDRDALNDAVDRLGVLLELPDGEWIAIRYRDSHAWPGYSIAVALTSDGRWLESSYHYCGLFGIYKHLLERLQEATTEEERGIFEDEIASRENLHRLRTIETQRTLDEAVEELLAMDFFVSLETRPAKMAKRVTRKSLAHSSGM
jgi:hypothetical protein